jgi:hypothetical protein
MPIPLLLSLQFFLFCRRKKEQELNRGGTTEVSPAMTPWRNSDPTKK